MFYKQRVLANFYEKTSRQAHLNVAITSYEI